MLVTLTHAQRKILDRTYVQTVMVLNVHTVVESYFFVCCVIFSKLTKIQIYQFGN